MGHSVGLPEYGTDHPPGGCPVGAPAPGGCSVSAPFDLMRGIEEPHISRRAPFPALAAWSRHRASCAFPKLPFYGLWRLGLGLRSLRWSPRVARKTCPVGPLRVVRRPRPPPRGPCAVPHLIVIDVDSKNKVITPLCHIRSQRHFLWY